MTIGDIAKMANVSRAAVSRYLKCLDPDCVTVFIGPCIAKKGETLNEFIADRPNYAMTFGEMLALIHAKGIEFEPVEEEYQESSLWGKKFASSGGDIVLNDVCFGYEDKEILHGISLTIKQGEFAALVGPSGSGKTTIARLIASLWDTRSGFISYGGVNIKNIPLDDYNDKIAFVSQDNYLFDMTVRENIRLGRQSATDAEVEQAAKLCGCHDFIMTLENGYDTVVGTGGGHLSGGERQRISIARAMLKNADVIILDEATAYTDPENEAVIQRSVAKLVKGKTLIVIAHRLSTVMNADSIYVVNDGRIEESGTHEKLLEKGGLYSRMWAAHISAKDGDSDV